MLLLLGMIADSGVPIEARVPVALLLVRAIRLGQVLGHIEWWPRLVRYCNNIVAVRRQ